MGFKGQWESQFKQKDTKFGNFYIRRDQIRMVKFMNQKGSFNYYVSEELKAHVLELPYEGDHVSMMIILPPWEDNSLQETVKRMTPETLQGVISEMSSGFYKVEKLEVSIPKFSIEGSLELVEPLDNIGINTLFGGYSNLTGFLDQYQADHPFLFLIYDKQQDTILFFGVYQHPPTP